MPTTTTAILNGTAREEDVEIIRQRDITDMNDILCDALLHAMSESLDTVKEKDTIIAAAPEVLKRLSSKHVMVLRENFSDDKLFLVIYVALKAAIATRAAAQMSTDPMKIIEFIDFMRNEERKKNDKKGDRPWERP